MQPGTGEELIAVRAVAREDRLVEAVESLSREVRRRLGEASDAIRRSKPLPEVTTRSLEALKVYAEGVQASRDLNQERALEAAEEAIRLDSTFAMAHRLASLAHWGLGRLSETAVSATRAYELRDRLTDRERLHVEAFYHLNVDFDVRRAGEIYELVLSRYPDDFRATNNLGFVSSVWLGDYEQAYEAYERAHELAPYGVIGYSNTISAARRLGKWEVADSLSAAAKGLGMAAEAARWDVQLAVARENWARADTLCDALLAEATSATETRQRQILCGGLAASRGRVRQAIDLLEPASLLYADRHRLLDLANLAVAFAIVEQTRGQPSAALSYLAAMLERYPADSISEVDRYIVRTHLAVAAGTLGQTDLVDRIQATYPRDRDPPVWLARYGIAVEDAARALSAGAPARALEHLREVREFGYKPGHWEFDVNLLFGLTFEELGAVDSAVVYLERAINPGAFSGGGTWSLRMAKTQLPLVLRRLAELEESRGNTEAAIRQYRRFLDLWSDPDPELRDQVESAQRALARLTGAESS